MADIRINSLPSTATSFNSDDYIAIDGTSGGTRKMLAANPPFNDVILGSSGPSVKSTLSARAPRQGLVFSGGTASGTDTAKGTGNFSTFAVINLPSNPTSGALISLGESNAFQLQIDTSGKVAAALGGTGALTASTDSIPLGKNVLVGYVRSGTDTGTYYINGIASGTITDSRNYSVAGSVALGANLPTGSQILSYLSYNRALSSSEVVALYEAGAPAGADYNSASNTAINTSSFVDGIAGIVTCAASGGSFSGASATGFTAVGGGSAFAAVSSLPVFTVSPNQKIRVTYTATVNSGSVGVSLLNGSVNGISNEYIVTTGTATVELTANAYSTSARVCFYGPSGAAFNVVVSNVTITRVGLLLAPDAYQAGGGLSWYDTSGNSATITLPASGVSWNVPSSQKTASGWTFGGDLTLSNAAPYFLQTAGSSTNYNYHEFVNNTSGFLRVGLENSSGGGVVPGSAAYGRFLVGSGNYPLYLGTNNIIRMTIAGDGNATLAGNLTVSGTGTSSVAGNLYVGSSTQTGAVRMSLDGLGTAGNVPAIRFQSAGVTKAYIGLSGALLGTTATDMLVGTDHAGGGVVFITGDSGSVSAKLTSGGNLLLKSDGVDGGNGKLQLATHTTSAGGIGFGTDSSLFSASATVLRFNGQNADTQIQIAKNGTTGFGILVDGASTYITASGSSGVMYLRTNGGTTALTLDSSQNATFAGGVRPEVAPSTSWKVDFASSVDVRVEIAANGTYDLASGSGKVFIWDNNGNGVCEMMAYYGNTAILWQDSQGLYSTTENTASKVNFYYNNGTSKYRIQNKTAATVPLFISTIRLRTSV